MNRSNLGDNHPKVFFSFFLFLSLPFFSPLTAAGLCVRLLVLHLDELGSSNNIELYM